MFKFVELVAIFVSHVPPAGFSPQAALSFLEAVVSLVLVPL